VSEVGEHGRLATAVGNAITRLHRDYYGRGATSTRTIWQGNFIGVILEDIYTPVERTLIEAGNQEDVRRTRQVFQDAMRDRFIDAVEGITGRKVIQFMSQVGFDPDMAIEFFALERAASDEPPSADGSGRTATA
jgi:uncharacterized protein YbcI